MYGILTSWTVLFSKQPESRYMCSNCKKFLTLTSSFSFQIVLYSFYKKQREVRLYEKSLLVF